MPVSHAASARYDVEANARCAPAAKADKSYAYTLLLSARTLNHPKGQYISLAIRS